MNWLVVDLPFWKIWVRQLGVLFPTESKVIKFHGSKPPTIEFHRILSQQGQSRGLPDSSSTDSFSKEPRCRSWTCENPAVWSPDRFFLWRGVGGKDLGYWGFMGISRDSWGLMGMNEFLALQLEKSNYDDFGAGGWCFSLHSRGAILWNHGRIFHAQEEHDLEII